MTGMTLPLLPKNMLSFSRRQRCPIHLHAIPRKGARQSQLLAIPNEHPGRNTKQHRDASQDGSCTIRAQVAVHGLCQERHEARDDGPDKGEAGERGSAVEKVRVGKEAAERVRDLVDSEPDGNQRERGHDPGEARRCWRDRPGEPEEPDGQGWGGEGEAHDFVFSVGI